MTRWVEWASWWNGHLGGMGILVERASWWNGHLGGTGILVERASWWNGHLGGTGILVERASCPYPPSGGQDVHRTDINGKIEQCRILNS
ncbi:hypothetical protein [Moorena sp. SIO4A1]|uniref:hypothetical protein n=1 Tax=Moorena sp. SIO4A1 TaxID=2607835 RepID=UPI0025D70850|nr:hypothetical protein [Moorena sp. SIO4A1]